MKLPGNRIRVALIEIDKTILNVNNLVSLVSIAPTKEEANEVNS